MDWKKAAERKEADRIPFGKYDGLRVTRIIRGKKDGTMFASEKGSPQMMFIIGDNQDREIVDMITLDERNAWKLAQYLEAMGVDMDAMTRDGVDISAFQDEAFAAAQLIDRPFAAEIRPNEQKPEFPKIVPFKRNDGAKAGVVSREDIPF